MFREVEGRGSNQALNSELEGTHSVAVRLANCVGEIGRLRGELSSGVKRFPHPFPARMPMDLATLAIGSMTHTKHRILDPMCGGGSTLRACADLRRNGVGIDIDPLACILTKACSNPCDPSVIEQLGDSVWKRAAKVCSQTVFTDFTSELSDEEIAFLNYWFPTDNQHKLFALAKAIEQLIDEQHQETFLALFSSTIIARMGGASYALDLSRSRPHRSLTKPMHDPLDLWLAKVREFARYSAAREGSKSIRVQSGDARDMKLIRSSSVDFILTSPPYINAIDYIRTSKFSLIFMGKRLEALREIRGTMIGSERGIYNIPVMEQLERRLIAIKDQRRAAVVRRYLLDMSQSLREAHRTLKPGGTAIYALGPSIISRSRYDASDVFGELAELIGFTVVQSSRREIARAGRSLPAPSGKNGKTAIYKRMTCEAYVGLMKSR